MPRSALRSLAGFALALAISPVVVAQAPHLDPALVSDPCSSCHAGHGMSGSPMLRDTQVELCLGCHGSPTERDEAVRNGRLNASARPPLLSVVLSQASTHLLSRDAFSSREPGVVTCTSCHAAHGGSRVVKSRSLSGGQRLSPRDASRFEFELCQDCHGSGGASTDDESDISRLFSPNSRSFHPVVTPSTERSDSVLPSLAGMEINCTDCHGNSDPTGARGPHGSDERFLLAASYVAVDGDAESRTTYALCYRCHQREQILDSVLFPEHRRHVVDLKASCSTCHNPHGSVDSRALMRFDEGIGFVAVSPSITAGRLGFESELPGDGACYLTCHGYDHGPVTYGAAEPDTPPGVRSSQGGQAVRGKSRER